MTAENSNDTQTNSTVTTSPSSSRSDSQLETSRLLLDSLQQRINSRLIGQSAVVNQVLVALVANGHVLLEGVPGLGKTLLVRLIASCFNGGFNRIQFTPDLMPSDITGHVMYDMKESQFHFRQGPVFTNLLLADEVNRAPAKTQAALLEVMQERQVTLEGDTKPLPNPFIVLATQNPIDQEGTYPLPDAQLDRFLMKIMIDYPSRDHEVQLINMVTTGVIDEQVDENDEAIITPSQIRELQLFASNLHVDARVAEYAVNLVRATRETTSFLAGAGPRASIALIRCARAQALINGNDFVLPDDIKSMAYPVLRHRVTLSADIEIEGRTIDSVLRQVIDTVEAPRL